jgi:hypothetical protein
LQFGGTLRGDIWSCNVNFVASPLLTELSDADQQAKAVTCAAAVKAWMNASGGGWGVYSLLTYTKFNRIKPDGSYYSEGTTNAVFESTPYAPAGATAMPNNTALAVSWTTGAARGLAHSGRIFIPAPSVSLSAATGKVASGNLIPIANAAAVFINACNNDPGLGLYDVVASVVSGVGDGATRKITGVRIGDVLDVQNRRRNAFPEVYSVNATAIT